MKVLKVFKTLLIPFQAFWNLTFERKMMLLVVIAIFVAVIFYSWDIWKMQSPKTIKEISPIQRKIRPLLNDEIEGLFLA